MNPAARRRVVLNSWEGVWFTFDEEKLLQMIRNAAKLGVELFVLDDGWFGNGRYARDDDHQGLGDWQMPSARSAASTSACGSSRRW